MGPVKLYQNFESRNFENSWQFAKVYLEYVDEEQNPTLEYFKWAEKGWKDSYTHRYPMGKGRKPLYSWWDGRKLDYIQARKEIYIPLYREVVQKSSAFEMLQKVKIQADEMQKDLYLLDFDAYDHHSLGWSYQEVINCEFRKMGHAFVLAMLLENFHAL